MMPWNLTAAAVFAAVLQRSGDTTRAEKMLRTTRNSPGQYGAPRALATFYFLCGEMDLAQSGPGNQWSSAIRAFPRCRHLHCSVQQLLAGAGESDEPGMTPRPLLHLEGAVVLAMSVGAYRWSHGSWLMFALLFLVPDLSMIGYAGGARAGSITYNAIHTYVGPLLLGHIRWPGSIAQRSRLLLSGSRTLASTNARLRLEIPDAVQGHALKSGSSRGQISFELNLRDDQGMATPGSSYPGCCRRGQSAE